MLDALFADMAVTEATDLILAHAFGVGGEASLMRRAGGSRGAALKKRRALAWQ